MAIVDVHWCVFTSQRYTLFADKVCQWCDIHTGVGFCVARSDDNGQSRASECGTSDGKTPTLFCIRLFQKRDLLRMKIFKTYKL